jgi:hypothetical protein
LSTPGSETLRISADAITAERRRIISTQLNLKGPKSINVALGSGNTRAPITKSARI